MEPLILHTRCTENHVEDDSDGGRVLLQMIVEPHVKPDAILGANIVLGYERDDPMRAFPTTREEKQDRWYKVTIEEESPIPAPPPPEPERAGVPRPRTVEEIRAELAAAEAREAAANGSGESTRSRAKRGGAKR